MTSAFGDDTGDMDLSSIQDENDLSVSGGDYGEVPFGEGPYGGARGTRTSDAEPSEPSAPSSTGTDSPDARREAARIREEAREQGAMIVAEMREQAQTEAARIVEHGKAQIQAEFRRVSESERRGLRTEGDDRLVVTALMGDDGPTEDLIGIAGDARALAALLASRALKPPAAVGLYGAWGSGKTFFMRQIETNIAALADSDPLGVDFCPNVAHVWFNAWHYAEGNLWASLVDRIFSVLGERPSHYRERVQEAIEKLAGAEEITGAAEVRLADAEARVLVAQDAVDEATKRRDEALDEASTLRAKDLWSAIDLTAEERGLKDKVQKAAADLGIPVLVQTTRDLRITTGAVVDAAGRARTLAGAGGANSPLAFALYALVAVAGGSLCLAALLRTFDDWVGTATLVIGQVVAIAASAQVWMRKLGSSAKTLLAPAEALKRTLDARVGEVQANTAEEITLLERQAATAESELRDANRALLDARAAESAAATERSSLHGTRLLRSYLKERAESVDYQSYLGVVALAQRDLSDLAELMEHAGGEEGSELDRIVLYIDDLDRCAPNTVVDVLEAVHLLLAFPLFVVVVGVSPTWLEQALKHEHDVLLAGFDSASLRGSPTRAADYLEKIFQLTYSLRPLTDVQSAALLLGMANATKLRVERAAGPGQALLPKLDPPAVDHPGLPLRSEVDLASALSLQARELLQLETVGPLVSSSPRRAQRFLNLYLVLRARFEESDEDNDALLYVAAIAIGLPRSLAIYLGRPQAPELDSSIHNVFDRLTFAAEVDAAEARRLQAFRSRPGMADKYLSHEHLLAWLHRIWNFLPLGYQPSIPDSDAGAPPHPQAT